MGDAAKGCKAPMASLAVHSQDRVYCFNRGDSGRRIRKNGTALFLGSSRFSLLPLHPCRCPGNIGIVEEATASSSSPPGARC